MPSRRKKGQVLDYPEEWLKNGWVNCFDGYHVWSIDPGVRIGYSRYVTATDEVLKKAFWYAVKSGFGNEVDQEKILQIGKEHKWRVL